MKHKALKYGVGVTLILTLNACGLDGLIDNDTSKRASNWAQYTGSPASVTSLAFLPDGSPIILGASQYTGARELMAYSPSEKHWFKAKGFAGLKPGDKLLQKGKKVYLRKQRQDLYHLTDTSQLALEKISPANTSGGNIDIWNISPDGNTIFASTDRLPSGESGSAMAYGHGEKGQWQTIPGAEIKNFTTLATVVDKQGVLSYSTQDGIYQGTTDGVRRVVDCDVPELLYCQSDLTQLAVEPDGAILFALNPQINDLRGIFRIAPGGNSYTRVIGEPEAHPYMESLQTLDDGNVYLISGSAITNTPGRTFALYRLNKEKNSWELKLEGMDSQAYVYVLRDNSTLFRYASGYLRSGIQSIKF